MNNDVVVKLLSTIKVANQLGEGVQWHIDSQTIWWTDIQGYCLYSYCVAHCQVTKYLMPDRVGCFAFIENDERFIVAFAAGIALFTLSTGELTWLAQPEKHIVGNRFNDGRVDRQGRFWAGSMVEETKFSQQSAALYRMDSNQHAKKVVDGIEISNGLCWSPDGLTMYHADSPKGEIYQYDVDPVVGDVSNKRLLAKTKAGSFPDGACVDSQGYIWNAQWGGGRIVRYKPQGDIALVVDLPVSQPCCVTIGGPDLNWLIITSAKQDLSASELALEPLAGHLFIYQLQGIHGLAESRYIL
jgi:L-arabinonolactonase